VSGSDGWCTPPEIVDPLHRFFPRFSLTGLDPCSNANSIVDAARVYTCGALYLPWNAGEVYSNPPYSDLLRFTKKVVAEVRIPWKGKRKELVYLVPVATSTEWWRTALHTRYAAAAPLLCFTKRIPFLDDNGMVQTTARFDSVLMVWAKSQHREEEFCDLFAPMITTVVHAKHHTFPRAA
jgi:hypothetical protein